MLQVRQLRTGYDGVPVVFGVDFSVGEGEIVAIVGSNGAGKSTILRAVSGLIRPMAGSIEFMGKPITGMRAHAVTALGIAHVPEGRHVFSKMSVEDNLLLGAHVVLDKGRVAETLRRVYDTFPILFDRRSQKAETLSGGEQQMLAVGRGLMSNPRLIMVDEISLGLMPIMVDKVLQVLKQVLTRITVSW